VTGIVTDVARISALLRRHGALSCWDYAAVGPHLPIDMRDKDAVFLSPHKFPGGPSTPGVLVAKRSLFRNRVPVVPGGGTIRFVSPRGHSYHPDPAVREEGGTPAIVESIRAGLVFALKEAVGVEEIRRCEQRFVRRALRSWGADPRIIVYGNLERERLAIVSLGLRHGRGLLHSDFAAALLNDLFGIQVRSGCFCAGPYIHRLLPIDDQWSRRMDAEVASGHEGAKLSLLRVTFDYTMSDAVVDYIVEAVHLLAAEGWKLLPRYQFDPQTARWRHRSASARPPLSLEDVSFASPRPARLRVRASDGVLAGYLAAARRILREAEAAPAHAQDPDLTRDFERIRWFPLPSEAAAELVARRRRSLRRALPGERLLRAHRAG
jgi:hypothetical protein